MLNFLKFVYCSVPILHDLPPEIAPSVRDIPTFLQAGGGGGGAPDTKVVRIHIQILKIKRRSLHSQVLLSEHCDKSMIDGSCK